MIGGYDITSDIPASTENFRTTLELTRLQWPNAVVEDIETDQCRTIEDVLKSSERFKISEFFLYPNFDAYKAWTELGGTEENRDKMLHVLMDEQGITIVADSPDSQLAGFANRVLENLKLATLQSRDELIARRDEPVAA